MQYKVMKLKIFTLEYENFNISNRHIFLNISNEYKNKMKKILF